MLDTKSTFDDLVATYSADEEQAERILANRFYRNISGALSGTQEYMAMEKLYELHADSDFDLVVVDTPPTRHALDFIDAPRRLTRFLDHRLYRVLTAPTRGMMRAVNAAAQTFMRSVSKVVGARRVRRRHRVLPGVRGHGGRLQGARRQGAAPAVGPVAPPSSSSPHRGGTRSARPTSSRRSSARRTSRSGP